MSGLTEIDAIEVIDDALEQLEDEGARDRVLRWAWAKYSQSPPQMPGGRATEPSSKQPSRRAKKKKTTRPSLSIAKELNLRPKGGQSFRDFATAKKPSTAQQKCTVAVYYLSRVLGVAGVNTDHVFTCFRDAGWRTTANLYNTLVLTAHRKGWLDTSDMNNIVLTTVGETMVEYDLQETPTSGDPR